MAERHYVSKKNETVRMFESDFVEFFSRVHLASPPVLYLLFVALESGVFAGLVFGYVCYDMLHYATHHFPMKRGLWLWLKQYHLRHHYKDDDAGFGISSPLWDYIFGTTRK